nr:hypothetical protein [Plantibacter cousiniae]
MTGYVCHVADNLRLWAERVSAAMASGDTRITGYDPDAVALAQGYDEIALPVALGVLERSAQTWVSVLADAVAAEVVLLHESRGQQTAADIASNNGHDAHHHAWDITRSIHAAEAAAEQT